MVTITRDEVDSGVCYYMDYLSCEKKLLAAYRASGDLVISGKYMICHLRVLAFSVELNQEKALTENNMSLFYMFVYKYLTTS